MNHMTASEFAEHMARLAESAEPFKPTATYDKDGDCIEFLASPEPFYAERIDDLVTVYYSLETNEIIGSLIKGVSRFRKNLDENLPGWVIEIIDGRVQIVHIFRAHVWQSNPDPASLRGVTYRKLIKVAEESGVEAQLCAVS